MYKSTYDVKILYCWQVKMAMLTFKLLLEKRALVDIQDDRGISSLMRASAKGHVDVVEVLLANNANNIIGLRNIHGISAI